MSTSDQPILVLAAKDKTGRRVADRLEQRGIAVRRASRSSHTPFDWNDSTTWGAAYIAYRPDLTVPEAAAAISGLLAWSSAEASGSWSSCQDGAALCERT